MKVHANILEALLMVRPSKMSIKNFTFAGRVVVRIWNSYHEEITFFLKHLPDRLVMKQFLNLHYYNLLHS